jgi:tetrahydromethanopterin S-methyltransferase subunit G
MKRYTLTECYDMLNVDPKTFRSWLQRDSIQTTPSKADPRVKYLTEEQVLFLAKEHERTLAPSAEPAEIIPPNAYKLLVDQADTVERQVTNLVAEQLSVREALAEQETRVSQDITTLNGTLDERITELRSLVDAKYRQHEEAIATLVTQAQQQMTELREALDRQHQQHESLATLTSENQSQVEQLRDLMVQNDQQVRQRIQEVSTTFTERYQEIAEALHRQRTEMEQMIGEQLRNVTTDLQQVERDVAVDAAATHERLQAIEQKHDILMTHVEAAKSIGLGAQQRADRQDVLIATLQQQLLELQTPKKATGAARKKTENRGE